MLSFENFLALLVALDVSLNSQELVRFLAVVLLLAIEVLALILIVFSIFKLLFSHLIAV